MGITLYMRELIDPYWRTVPLTSVAQFVLFLRWLYRPIRNDEVTRTFVEDMATRHLRAHLPAAGKIVRREGN